MQRLSHHFLRPHGTDEGMAALNAGVSKTTISEGSCRYSGAGFIAPTCGCAGSCHGPLAAHCRCRLSNAIPACLRQLIYRAEYQIALALSRHDHRPCTLGLRALIQRLAMPPARCRQMSHNQITGTLPGSWSRVLSHLSLLDLSYNQLTGTVPLAWADEQQHQSSFDFKSEWLTLDLNTNM